MGDWDDSGYGYSSEELDRFLDDISKDWDSNESELQLEEDEVQIEPSKNKNREFSTSTEHLLAKDRDDNKEAHHANSERRECNPSSSSNADQHTIHGDRTEHKSKLGTSKNWRSEPKENSTYSSRKVDDQLKITVIPKSHGTKDPAKGSASKTGESSSGRNSNGCESNKNSFSTRKVDDELRLTVIPKSNNNRGNDTKIASNNNQFGYETYTDIAQQPGSWSFHVDANQIRAQYNYPPKGVDEKFNGNSGSNGANQEGNERTGFGLVVFVLLVIYIIYKILGLLGSDDDDREEVNHQQNEVQITSSVEDEYHEVSNKIPKDIVISCLVLDKSLEFFNNAQNISDADVSEAFRRVKSVYSLGCSGVEYMQQSSDYNLNLQMVEFMGGLWALKEIYNVRDESNKEVVRNDILFAQTLLNSYREDKLKEDGIDGPKTREAIRDWRYIYSYRGDTSSPSHRFIFQIISHLIEDVRSKVEQ